MVFSLLHRIGRLATAALAAASIVFLAACAEEEKDPNAQQRVAVDVLYNQAMDQLLQQRRVEVEQGRAIQDQLLDDQIDLDNAKLLYIRSVSDYFLTLAQIADLLDSPELDDPDLQ